MQREFGCHFRPRDGGYPKRNNPRVRRSGIISLSDPPYTFHIGPITERLKHTAYAYNMLTRKERKGHEEKKEEDPEGAPQEAMNV